jgi:hypothetical protein
MNGLKGRSPRTSWAARDGRKMMKVKKGVRERLIVKRKLRASRME